MDRHNWTEMRLYSLWECNETLVSFISIIFRLWVAISVVVVVDFSFVACAALIFVFGTARRSSIKEARHTIQWKSELSLHTQPLMILEIVFYPIRSLLDCTQLSDEIAQDASALPVTEFALHNDNDDDDDVGICIFHRFQPISFSARISFNFS